MTRSYPDFRRPRPDGQYLGLRLIGGIIVCGVTLALISMAQADKIATAPPARFDHAYRGKVIIIVYRDSTASTKACRRRGADADACSWISRGRDRDCAIIVPAGLTAREKASIIRHEVGHCNGWSADHRR